MEEPRYRLEELKALPNIWPVFEQYGFRWMAEPSGHYSLELVQEFYASYATSVDLSILVGKRYRDQPLLTHILV